MTSGVRRPEWATPKRCKGPRCRRWVPWEACRDRHQYKLKDTCSASCAGAYGRAQRPDTGQRQPHRCALPECEQWVARREGECDSSYRSRRYHDEGCRKVARARGQVNRRKKERPVRVWAIVHVEASRAAVRHA